MKNKISNTIRDNNPYRNLVYKRGYVIADKPIDVSELDNWELTQIGHYYIYSDRENEPTLVQKDFNWCFILGYAVDLRFETDDKKVIADKICNYLESSEEAFFDYIDEIAGRYLIMYQYNGVAKILGDATCMRTIFYSKEQNVIASHTGIMKELINSKPNPNMKKEWRENYTRGVRYYLPGNYTPFEDIYFLTPNLVMEVETKQVKRFYPRENLIIDTAQNQAERIIELVDKELKIVSNSGKSLLLSLSAGEDSRTSLALARDYIDKFQTFTYYRTPKRELSSNDVELERDSIVVQDMAENLNIKNHKIIPLKMNETSKDFEDFCEVLKVNTFTAHNRTLAYFYLKNFSQDKHVRSNIYEISRASYWKDKQLPTRVSPQALSKCYAIKAEHDKDINHYFAEYFNYAEMDKIMNYNPYDLFYWEYRMGTWHAQLLLEGDAIHDTYIIINCRKILSSFMGVSFHDKINNNVVRAIIQTKWPILYAWGVNSLTRPIDSVDKDVDSYGESLNELRFEVSSPTKNDLNYFSKIIGKKAKFYMITKSPKAGDSLAVSVPLMTKPQKNYECLLELRSLFENHDLLGKAIYKVFIGDQLLLTEDLAAWKEMNLIRFNFKAIDEKAILQIRIEFMEDCNHWRNWEQRTMMILERLVLRSTSEEKPFVVASSPYSKMQDFVLR